MEAAEFSLGANELSRVSQSETGCQVGNAGAELMRILCHFRHIRGSFETWLAVEKRQ
jgi:hypothetical protein